MPRELTDAEVQAFRARLCESFTKLFAERGYAAVTMRALAEDIGCSPMTPYRYFQDKGEILAAARAAGFRKLSDRLESVRREDAHPAELTEHAARVFLNFAKEEPDTYRLMYTNPEPDAPIHGELEAEIARARKNLSLLAEVVPQIRSSGVRPAAVAQAYWAALHGAIALHLANSFDESTEFDEVVAVLMSILIQGGRSLFGLDDPLPHGEQGHHHQGG